MFSNIKEVSNSTSSPKIIKTRLCKNFNNCTYGDACHYAHSLSEIVIVDCAYKNDCIFIENDKNCCFNSNNGKVCFFKHPGETVEQYHLRVGNINVKTYSDDIKISPKKIQLIENKNYKGWKKVTKDKNITLEDDYNSPTNVKASELKNIIEDILDQQIKKVTLIIDYEE